MKFIENIRDFFNRNNKNQQKHRSFAGANKTRFSNWINSTLTPINVDLEKDLSNVVTKCRDLAKNNNIVRAYLSMCVKNIIGKARTSFTITAC